ncbi:hypothetical protein [Planobispora takensis]|uniref:hypothetical protein n=1 Tax=Planobispora takensis TaxID=1367882 RepID=UPI0019403FFC|nr:hypothetical protein [Planobispora takensis]
MLLARYEFTVLRAKPERSPVTGLTLMAPAGRRADAEAGARRGLTHVRATMLARDLASSPPSMLTAAVLAETAQRLAAECGPDVEVFEETALREMGCGGLLGVNAGSVGPPRMIRIRYRPDGAPADAAR